MICSLVTPITVLHGAVTRETENHKENTMAIQLSVGARNDRLDAIEVEVGSDAKLQLWTGTVPADCATTDSGTKLVEMSLPTDWMNAAATGSKTILGSWSGTGITEGDAGYFRIKPTSVSGVNAVIQGTVAASGADMNLDNISIATSQTVTVTEFTLTDDNA
jgi:hypothetical protein